MSSIHPVKKGCFTFELGKAKALSKFLNKGKLLRSITCLSFTLQLSKWMKREEKRLNPNPFILELGLSSLLSLIDGGNLVLTACFAPLRFVILFLGWLIWSFLACFVLFPDFTPTPFPSKTREIGSVALSLGKAAGGWFFHSFTRQ